MGSSKAKKQVVGYKYSISMQLGLCHGIIGAIRAVWFADKVAWTGNVARDPLDPVSKVFSTNKPGLFGGEDSEGGVAGNFHIAFGGLDQELRGVKEDGTYDSGLMRGAPKMATNYRGLAVLELRSMYIGTNPYMKDISVEVERYWDEWYPQTAQIGIDANPAHIIYECCTNDQWGLGYDPSMLNEASFRASALKLYNEGFGLSLAWSDQTTVDDFINEILEHIDGDFFYDQNIGKWRLRLVRDTDESVFTFDPSNSTLTSFSRKGIGETVNQLYVKYVSRATEEYLSVAIQDLANIESQSGTASSTKDFRGIREEGLALRVCQRDLQTISSALASAELVADRRAWDLSPGDVVTLIWPPYKIAKLQMRVLSAEFGDSESGDIRFSLIEDVFGKVDSVFGGGTTPGWEDQATPATPFDALSGWELPYWFVAQAAGSDDVNPLIGFTTVLPVTSNAGFRMAEFYTGDPSPTSEVGMELQMSGGRTPSGLLALALPQELISTMRIDTSSVTGLDDIEFNSFAVIGEGVNAEIVRVRGSGTTAVYTVDRGLIDTQPLAWPSGTRVYFVGTDSFPEDRTLRALGTSVTYRAIMQTQLDATDPEAAQTVVVPVNARQGRPYPPANVRINRELWPEAVDATLLRSMEVTWSTRNRLIQVDDTMLVWDAGDVTPEAGTTFSIQVVQAGVVLLAFEGLTGNSQNISLDGVQQGTASIRIWAVRDGLPSYQVVDHSFELLIEEEVIDWSAVPFPGRRLGIVGDSISFANSLHVPGNGTRYEQYSMSQTGYWPKAAAILNHRLELEPGIQPDLNGRKQGLNMAIAGSRVMNWWLKAFDNQNDGVLDQGPMYTALKNINAFDVVILMGGTNDLSFNRSAAQVLADIRRAVVELARQGKWVFLMTITARTTDLLQGYTLAQQATIRNRLLQVNEGLRSWVSKTQPPNVYLVDAFAATVGPNGMDPAGWVSSSTSATAKSVRGNYRPEAPGIVFMHDGLHSATGGAQSIAKALAAAMTAAGVPERVPGTLGPLTLGPNIIPNPTFVITTARPAGGISSVLGRALGLGPALTNSSHAVGPDTYGNVGLGYTFGKVPDYWFFYRSSNSDDESYSNFNQYMWADLSNTYAELVPYLQDSTWTEGAATTSVVTVGGRKGLKIEFRTQPTGNKNEAFVVRTFIPRGQHGAWDGFNGGDVVVPNTVYAPGDRLAAEAEVQISNIQGLHTSIVTLEFMSIDTTATAGGDFSSAGTVISGTTGGMNFWPPSDIDLIRTPTDAITLQMRTPVVIAPTPAAGENHQYARLNFQFACDASAAPASVTVIIFAPSVNTVTALDFPPTLPDQHGLGHDLGENLGGAN